MEESLWRAIDTLRNDTSPSEQKNIIITLLFLQYISENKDYDIPKHCSFQELYDARKVANNKKRIEKALLEIEKANPTLHDVFQNISFNKKNLNDLTLIKVLESLNTSELKLSPEIAGNAFELILQKYSEQEGKSHGEHYTPLEVSTLISSLAAPQDGESICDPACGSGSLLIGCGKHIKETLHHQKKYKLYGQEKFGLAWSLAKINMIINNEENHQIEWGDSIKDPKLLESERKLMKFDVVISNPPFSLKPWGYDFSIKDPFERFTRGIPPKSNGDYAFISHMIATLKPDTGRMATIAPHGVLFRSNERTIRKNLIDENLLDAVIGLPPNIFSETSIPTTILIFKTNRENKDILFIDASREFTPQRIKNKITRKSIEQITNTYHSRKKIDKYSYLSTYEEIKENDYNLNIPRYIDTFEEEEKVNLEKLKKEREILQSEIIDLEYRMNTFLEKYKL